MKIKAHRSSGILAAACLISQSKQSEIFSVFRRRPKRVSSIDRCHKRRPVLFMETKRTCEGVK